MPSHEEAAKGMASGEFDDKPPAVSHTAESMALLHGCKDIADAINNLAEQLRPIAEIASWAISEAKKEGKMR